MNKKSLFITATNTDIGKTHACEKLLRYYSKKGYRVGYFKPIETGVVDAPIDGTAMLNLTKELNRDFDVTIDDVVPFQYRLPASPFVAKENSEICIKKLIEKRDYLLKFCDFLIIEGAGGLMVPIEKDFFMIDLIKAFDTKAVLITPSKLGCINDTLLSIDALKNRNIEFDWYINLYEEEKSFFETTMPFYKEYFEEVKFLDSFS